jgi:DNA-binding Xre family transcriptional regulator
VIRAVAGGEPQHTGSPDPVALQPRCGWWLRELMAVRRNWFNTTKLLPALRRHGFDLDRSTVYRLVSTNEPPKVPLELIVALCKILDCRFEDLVVELEPEQDARPALRGLAPVMPDGPALSGDFFDAER